MKSDYSAAEQSKFGSKLSLANGHNGRQLDGKCIDNDANP